MVHANTSLDQEAGFHILRLFNSGFFDTFPRIKLIIGYMGETLTFQLDRVTGYR